MSDPGERTSLSGLLGPMGSAALEQATQALAQTTDTSSAALRVAGWTAADWAFRFELPNTARHVVVHVPHDGAPVVVRDAGPGPDPLAPGEPRAP